MDYRADVSVLNTGDPNFAVAFLSGLTMTLIPAKYYARWCGDGEYLVADLARSEVPADLLARHEFERVRKLA